MFTSVGPSLASLRSSLAGLTLPSSQQQQKKKKEIDAIAQDLEEAEGYRKGIQATLADAEEKQIHKESVRDWLHALRDLAYKIEDLRDVYEYEVVAREVQASKKAPSSSGDAGTSTWTKVEESVSEVRPSFLSYIAKILKDAVRNQKWMPAKFLADVEEWQIHDDSLSPLLDDSFRKQIANDLGIIREEFDAIYKRRKALHLKEADGPDHSPNDGISRREVTGHIPVASVCHGRDGDLQQLRNFLIADHGDGSMNFEVIAVIGMGGMGKTTLAQYVLKDLKDPQVAGYFDKIGWVHVSEVSDVIRLTKAAIESFSEEDCGLSGLSPLQNKITKLIEDKKVLLVADDVWDTEKIGWESFVTPFRDGAKKGSKILVTTRFREVVKGTKAVKSIELKRLSEEDGWSLLKEHAFPNQSDGVDNAEELEIVGKGIVDKCEGLPLSIKLLGSLLSYKENDEKEWRNVMESNLLDLTEGSETKKKILGSLYLSYLHLSPKLRSCFKCCSKYPNGKILLKDLKHSWIAYDLVKDEKEASRCFYELQSRSFLEIMKNRYYEHVELHDHIYDLAQYAQGEEHLKLRYDGTIPEEVGMTRFSGARNATITFQDNMHSVDVNSCCHINTTQVNVRTLTLESFAEFRIHLSLGKYLRELNIGASFVEFTSCDGCQDQLKCLRLLHLRGKWSSIFEWVFRLYNLRYLSVEAPDLKCLSDSVCDLRNLRGLSIQSSQIKYLPEAISRLTNLQELDLQWSHLLICLPKTISELVNLHELNLYSCRKFGGLPEGIINLTNLRILNLNYTPISFMPKGLGALSELRELTYYVAEFTEGGGLAELKNMRYLEDLSICNLCDIVKEEDASQAELDKKKHIRKLLLNWEKLGLHVIENEEKIAHDHEEQVLEKLRPHRNLEELVITGYSGLKLPSWMGDESFTKLVTVQLYTIKYCTSLSPIDQLPSLEMLLLYNMKRLKAVVPKHSSGHVDSNRMESATEQRLSFPMLKYLEIWRCKSIELLPLRNFTSLEYVQVAECENVEHMDAPYQSLCPLRQITIKYCRNFHFSPDPRLPNPSWRLSIVEEEEDNDMEDHDTDDDMATFHSPESD